MHIIVGLIIAFVIVAVVARQRSGTRMCRWREDRRLGNWHCVYCGARSEGEEKPRRCLRR